MAMIYDEGCRYSGSPFAIEIVAVEIVHSSGDYILEV